MKTVSGVIILVVELLLLFVTILVSPYRDELDLDVKQVNENGVLVLRFIYAILIVLSGLYLWRQRSLKSFIGILLFIIGLYALVRLIGLFSL